MILKTMVGFLLGFILGVGGTVFMVTSGTGNYIIAANPQVQELESKIRELVGQREFVTQRLEEVSRLTQRMAARFEDLEDRFTTLQRARHVSDDAASDASGASPRDPETAAQRGEPHANAAPPTPAETETAAPPTPGT